MPCASTQDAKMIRDYIAEYHDHGSYYLFRSKMFVSTFSGERCLFGMGDINSGWNSAVKSQFPEDIHFVPYFSLDPSRFSGLTVTDGLFNVSRFHRISKLADDASKWDSGWTKDDKDITFDSDKNYISNLGGKTYMAACSPWFFTVGGYSNSRFILSNASPSTMDVTRTTRTGSTAPMTGCSLHAGSSSSQTENKWIWCSY